MAYNLIKYPLVMTVDGKNHTIMSQRDILYIIGDIMKEYELQSYLEKIFDLVKRQETEINELKVQLDLEDYNPYDDE